MVAPPLIAALLLALPQSNPPAPTGEPAAEDEDVRKARWLAKIADDVTDSVAPLVGQAPLARYAEAIGRLPQNAAPAQILPLRSAYGDALRAVGRLDEAIREYEACAELEEKINNRATRSAILERLAIAWLRVGERTNCITRHNQDSCIFPLKGGAIHVDRTGSEKATRTLIEMLQEDPTDYGAMWLLNVARMTLGDWPDAVAPTWRIPPQAFASARDFPRLVDAAPGLGLNTFSHAGGAIFDDFTGDGRLDLVTSSMDPHERLHFFEQQPDRTFREVAHEKKLDGQLGGLQIYHFDADNDGRLDLYVPRGAWLQSFGEMPNSLLIQRPDGTFTDRTRAAGVEVVAPSQVAAVADVDLDGDLDLFVGCEGERASPGDPASYRYACRLFLNRGDGTFEDGTERAGVARCGYVKGAAFGDYDGDRLPDLYVSDLKGSNHLFHNEGRGEGGVRFRDVAFELGVADPIESFACWFFDWNNDGWLDLFVADYAFKDRMAAMGAYYRNGTTGRDVGRLYENDGHGRFRDVTRAAGLMRVDFPMGCNFGDVDNDGWPDVYLGTGDPSFQALWPNVLLRNDGGRRFEDVTAASGTGHLQKGHGVAFADWDEDGDQDLFVEMGGAYADDAFWDVLFENPGFGNHWLKVALVGRESNRFGVGSRIRVRIAEPSAEPSAEPLAERDLFHFVGANSSFGGNPLRAELGLGQAARIVELEVFWPKTGKTQRFTEVPLDRSIVIDEGSDRLELRSTSSGPAR